MHLPLPVCVVVRACPSSLGPAAPHSCCFSAVFSLGFIQSIWIGSPVPLCFWINIPPLFKCVVTSIHWVHFFYSIIRFQMRLRSRGSMWGENLPRQEYKTSCHDRFFFNFLAKWSDIFFPKKYHFKFLSFHWKAIITIIVQEFYKKLHWLCLQYILHFLHLFAVNNVCFSFLFD